LSTLDEELEQFRARLATALKMDTQDHWRPKVSVQSRGFLAEKLLEIAEEHEIPIVKDADLAEDLKFLDVGTPLPTELFAPVAEILAHIYMISNQLREDKKLS